MNIDQSIVSKLPILLTKTTAAQNEVALSYGIVLGLYFLAVVFAGTIVECLDDIYIFRLTDIVKFIFNMPFTICHIVTLCTIVPKQVGSGAGTVQ